MQRKDCLGWVISQNCLYTALKITSKVNAIRQIQKNVAINDTVGLA